MLSITGLKEARAAKTDALKAIVAKATAEHRDLTNIEQDAFDAGRGEVERIEHDLRNAEFLAEAERRMDGQPVGNSDQRFDVECRNYSLLRAIASQVPGMNVDAGREKEISAELERRSGRAAVGMLAPTSVFERRVDVVTTALPSAGPGGNIIATNLLAGQFIDLLRDNTICQRLGARVVSNLVGNVDIPKLAQGATGYWVAENAAITTSDAQFDKVQLSPKHCGALIEVSRNMVMQASPDIESIIRGDFAALLARALDKVAIQGGGSDEPSGILASSDIGDVPGGASGLALNYGNIIELIAKVMGANALRGSLAFATNAKVVARASWTLKISSDTSSTFILPSPGATEMAGYPLAVSNLVPSDITKNAVPNLSALIFGDWSQLIVGYWSALDVLVNPFDSTAYPKGNVMVRAMLTADVALRQPAAFAAIKDIVTT